MNEKGRALTRLLLISIAERFPMQVGELRSIGVVAVIEAGAEALFRAGRESAFPSGEVDEDGNRLTPVVDVYEKPKRR